MTNTMAINNEAILKDEMLSEEQLDYVQGGIAAELVIAGVTILIERGFSEADDLRDFVQSDAYKNMSNNEKNKALGKKLANSVALNAILGGLASPLSVVAAQVVFRKKGTGDTIRHGIENIFG